MDREPGLHGLGHAAGQGRAYDADATNTDRDRPHANVTVKDVPAFLGHRESGGG
jgi:hypothetical protein